MYQVSGVFGIPIYVYVVFWLICIVLGIIYIQCVIYIFTCYKHKSLFIHWRELYWNYLYKCLRGFSVINQPFSLLYFFLAFLFFSIIVKSQKSATFYQWVFYGIGFKVFSVCMCMCFPSYFLRIYFYQF